MAERITKAELARRLKISKARVSQYCAMGMPTLPDGTLDYEVAAAWIRAHVAVHSVYQPGRRRPTACIARVTPPTNTPSRSRPEPPEMPDSAAGGGISYAEARRRETVARMHERELNVAKLKGELVPLDRVMDAFIPPSL